MFKFFNSLGSKKGSGGFTIVEIIIVMAVAGVIMAVVLGAVPQAQRNQRNNGRKAIAQRLMSSLENYNGNNQGTYPFAGNGAGQGGPINCASGDGTTNSCNSWYTGYVQSGATNYININDPSTGALTTIWMRWATSDTSTPQNPGWVTASTFIYSGAVCSGTSVLGTGGTGGSASSKQFAMIIALESSGSWFCVDNR